MKNNKLKIIQENNRLLGGFSILSKEKQKRLTGGVLINETCSNYDIKACGSNVNKKFCTNYHVGSCIDTVNSGICRNLD